MENIVINVQGMSCQHCVGVIQRAVGQLDGVSKVNVNLETHTATVQYDACKVSLEKIYSEIHNQGYEIA